MNLAQFNSCYVCECILLDKVVNVSNLEDSCGQSLVEKQNIKYESVMLSLEKKNILLCFSE